MEEIVVTATRSQKSVQSNPWSVSVLNEDQLRHSTLDQLADVLADLPGLYVSDAGQPGQKRLRIRGEEARRMALLIDGQEFVDHREVGVPLLVDTANLARVEMVRGPASVLYGPKAMGGVINVITTRRHQRALEGGFNYTYNGATSGNLFSANLGGLAGSTDWHIAFTDVDQDNRESPDGEIENTSYQSRGASAQLSHIFGSHEFGAGFERFQSSSDVYVEPEVRFTPPFLDFAIDIPVRDRDKSRVTYRFHGGDGVLDGLSSDFYRQTSLHIE
jgi:hemoglobin/transferrin/lactoferrin receptor protein